MVRLRMEGNPHGLQEILLKPGLNRLGRLRTTGFSKSAMIPFPAIIARLN